MLLQNRIQMQKQVRALRVLLNRYEEKVNASTISNHDQLIYITLALERILNYFIVRC